MRSIWAFTATVLIIGIILVSSAAILFLYPNSLLRQGPTLASTSHSTTTAKTTASSSTLSHSSTSSRLSSTTSEIVAPKPNPELTRGNGYYLSTPIDMVQWDDASFSTLVKNLVQANVTYLYFNVPNLNNDSSLTDNFTLDTVLILRFEQLAGTHPFQYIAWTGTQTNPDALLGNFTPSGINETVTETYRAGFDGLLIDVEPVPNDSPQFVAMLKDFRTAMNLVDPSLTLGANSMNVHYGATPGQLWSWDPNYYENVTGLLSYVSPMLFESGTENQSQFVSYALGQISIAEQYSKAPIMYSIPNWYQNTTYHNPLAENITNSVIAFGDYVKGGMYPQLKLMLGLGIWAVDKTYVLTPGTQTQALETTPTDWNTFVSQWVDSNYPSKTGSSAP